jgi:hypothetical protein
MDIRKIVQEQVKSILSEARVNIENKSSSSSKPMSIINQAWERGLDELQYNKADGILTDEGSLIDIYMNNGDKLTWISKNNPATAGVYLNGEILKQYGSREKFASKYWDLVKQAYADSSRTKNAGV